MNYCLQTMSFQPKNKIKHPHPKTNIHTHPKITRKTIKEKKTAIKKWKKVMHSLKTLSNCCNWNRSTFNKMRLFANRVPPVFFQSPSCRIYFAEKNSWSFRISNAEPFYPISKEKKTNKSERYTDKLWDSCASIIWWLPNCRATWLHEIMGWICTYSLHSTWTVN